jgi:hypothetical protein
MTKDEFVGDADVKAMLTWFCQRFQSAANWQHSYVNRDTNRDWSCRSFFEAFQQYEWNGKGWPANKQELDAFRGRLRRAVEAQDNEDAFSTCEDILRWGGVWPRNGTYLHFARNRLLDELQHLSKILNAERTPNRADMLIPEGSSQLTCRMNAGFVKLYSVLLDYCVIYDGRVGAALGLLVRQFCEESGRTAVPPKLAFAYGAPKEGKNPKKPKKVRNPSLGGIRFPKLRAGDCRGHTEQTQRANWFLRAALALEPAAFSDGEEGFHELAAGLFMVGYDLGNFA